MLHTRGVNARAIWQSPPLKKSWLLSGCTCGGNSPTIGGALVVALVASLKPVLQLLLGRCVVHITPT
eukprot:5542588-Amphidinium_carterae.1